jgi:hypothetical protein
MASDAKRKGKPMNTREALHDDQPPVSKLVMSDRLITLAQEAERAGYTSTAHDLVNLACAVFDEAPRLLH